MQRVAYEMNCAETAFVWPEANGTMRLRWFTPTVEVDLCGHATLSAAHVLFTEGYAPDRHELVFSTRSGDLTAVRCKEGIALNFPATPPAAADDIPGLFDSLNVSAAKASFVGRSRFDAFVEFTDEATVRALQPDFASLVKLSARAVIVTAAAAAGSEVDFVSCFFAPGVGVPEDHVTGSAHCALAPYWCSQK